MPIKTYTEEFKRDAVALYQSSPGSSVQEIATDLGISRTTLKNWIAKYRTNTSSQLPVSLMSALVNVAVFRYWEMALDNTTH